jgi:hypothetical protein
MILIATAIAAFHLIQLHGPDGQEIDINPHEIASLREPSSISEGHFPKGTRCVVIMTNSRLNLVREDCHTIKVMTEEAQ